MTSAARYLCILFLLFSLIGCGAHSHTLYEWSGYDAKLYKHYKDPSNKEEFIQALKKVMDKAEPAGKVPPGVYAEYGFVMYEQGDNNQAILYFQKESDKWPESRDFMSKLIANVNKTTKNQKKNVRLPVGSKKGKTKPSSEVSK